MNKREEFLTKLDKAIQLAEQLRKICEDRLKWSEENDNERN
jgi:hypothetical protein